MLKKLVEARASTRDDHSPAQEPDPEQDFAFFRTSRIGFGFCKTLSAGLS